MAKLKFCGVVVSAEQLGVLERMRERREYITHTVEFSSDRYSFPKGESVGVRTFESLERKGLLRIVNPGEKVGDKTEYRVVTEEDMTPVR